MAPAQRVATLVYVEQLQQKGFSACAAVASASAAMTRAFGPGFAASTIWKWRALVEGAPRDAWQRALTLKGDR